MSQAGTLRSTLDRLASMPANSASFCIRRHFPTPCLQDRQLPGQSSEALLVNVPYSLSRPGGSSLSRIATMQLPCMSQCALQAHTRWRCSCPVRLVDCTRYLPTAQLPPVVLAPLLASISVLGRLFCRHTRYHSRPVKYRLLLGYVCFTMLPGQLPQGPRLRPDSPVTASLTS